VSELPFAIVADGELVESRVSDIEVPWWSFGKTVIAAAALTLVQDGALVLDAPLPGAPYTLRQLLAHTSGLPDYGGVGAYHAAVAAGEAPWSEAELLQRAAGERLLFAPGTGWAYSNIGYLKVVRLIEATTHAPLDRALAALVFGPLGVTARQAITAADLAGVAFAPPG
jgi:CubicO group peptidase (beta-lactamase class C family)